MHFITELFNQYGYIVLFAALALELVALPTPGETLMTYCGFLVYQGKLNLGISILVAVSGIIIGITLSYFIGYTLGVPFFKKYGSYIHMGPDRFESTANWFEKYGNSLLIIAYFIPGIRHITGYFSGITKIPFKRFAPFAYIGAFLWAGTFISLGKILGTNWKRFHGPIKRYLVIGSIIFLLALTSIYLYKNYKSRIFTFVTKSLKNSIELFHSLGRIKIAIAGLAFVFVASSILLIGLIQDFLENEFIKFDTITAFLVNRIFPAKWFFVMNYFKFLTTYQVLTLITLLTFLWIIVKGKNRFLETRFLILVVLGGEILEEALCRVFRYTGPLGLGISNYSNFNFPSEQALISVVVYGFAAFIILRHAKRHWIGTVAISTALIICLFTGFSTLFFKVQHSSDVIAGYTLGCVWLSLNIILLEVFRILPNVISKKD